MTSDIQLSLAVHVCFFVLMCANRANLVLKSAKISIRSNGFAVLPPASLRFHSVYFSLRLMSTNILSWEFQIQCAHICYLKRITTRWFAFVAQFYYVIVAKWTHSGGKKWDGRLSAKMHICTCSDERAKNKNEMWIARNAAMTSCLRQTCSW